jgi:hypothetical protein
MFIPLFLVAEPTRACLLIVVKLAESISRALKWRYRAQTPEKKQRLTYLAPNVLLCRLKMSLELDIRPEAKQAS